MGFNKVYKSLQEVFPQIDARVLRAVAIEHSKDADAAVETVLTEVIPFFNERSRPSTPLTGGEFVGERSRPSTTLTGNESVSESSEASAGVTSALRTADGPFVNSMGSTEDQNGYNMTADGQQSFHDAHDGHKEPIYDTYDGHHEGECNAADNENVNTFKIEASGGLKTTETITADRCSENGIKMSSDSIPCQTLGTFQVVHVETSENLNPLQEMVEYGALETGLGTTVRKENECEKSSADRSNSVASPASMTVVEQSTIPTADGSNTVASPASVTVDEQSMIPTADGSNSVASTASVAVDEQSLNPSESSAQLVVLHKTHGSNTEELDASLLSETVSQMECRNNVTGTEDSNLNDSMSQASQAHLIEVLEQVIADARNNKKILFATMQSVISLMREVELKEQAAEQAKVEAAMGGSDVLAKVEELKQMIQHAKEANCKFAGEVYGEKSILSSELRELQSRVLSLSEERDKSLAVLDEMHHAIEVRLVEAENEIEAAEQMKVEKEKAAIEALADEHLIMEKVVQESKMLKQQAEDNAKLQEFLMDRGQIVDMLQGEIAVICQDVSLLRDKFDEHAPFSKSLLSSQTSRMLVSSTSSSNGQSVKLLKEKFDEHFPFTKSLSSSQTSSILASSTSSSLNGQTSNKVESMSDRASEALETEKRDSFNQLAVKDDSDAAGLEEGWELFDSSETFR